MAIQNAEAGQKWLEEYFEYEYCNECRHDAKCHTAVPMANLFGTNYFNEQSWFARCDKDERQEACTACGAGGVSETQGAD